MYTKLIHFEIISKNLTPELDTYRLLLVTSNTALYEISLGLPNPGTLINMKVKSIYNNYGN